MRTELIDKIAKAIEERMPYVGDQIYDSNAVEAMSEYTYIENIQVNYNYIYGYVDVVGLEDDEFKELKRRFPDYLDNDDAEGEEE